MYPFKNPPAPTNRIWAACYMDSVTECFEIRTEAKTPGGIFTLYHKEYPIGTALTEFLYADVKVFPAHLGNIKTCLKEIRAGNDVNTQFLQLFSDCPLLAAVQSRVCAAGGQHPAAAAIL